MRPALRWLYATLFSVFLVVAPAAPAGAQVSISPVGPEFQVNTTIPREQSQSAIGSDAASNFVVVWRSLGDSAASTGIFGQRFDAGGKPLGGEFLIAPGRGWTPRVAVQPDGSFMVVFVTFQGDFGFLVYARSYGRDGQPLGEPFPLQSLLRDNEAPDIAPLPSGGYVVVWTSYTIPIITAPTQAAILVQRFDAHGRPLGEALIASQSLAWARVAVDSSGGFLVVWGFMGRRFDPSGAPVGPAFTIPGDPLGAPGRISTTLTAEPGGGYSLVWNNQTRTSLYQEFMAQRLDATGAPLGEAMVLERPYGPAVQPEVAADRYGNHLLLWSAASGDDFEAGMARLFDKSWRPLGPAFQLNSFEESKQFEPRAAFGSYGEFLAVWTSTAPQEPARGQDGSSSGVFGQRFAGTCLAGAAGLCLGEGRFRAEVAWRLGKEGEKGAGRAVPLGADTGAFWFFGPDNAELLVKVLDGRGVSGHFWLYYGALTDVEYDLTVIDTATGVRRVYHNPAGTMASRADVNAFPAAGAATAAEAETTAENGPAADPLPEVRLGDFTVRVEWTDPATGTVKTAAGAPFGRDSAYFWFFGENNVELIVKVLDGRGVNGHHWVFYGALTDLEYTIVVDREGQETRTYHNPRGRMASQADTRAFAMP